MLRLCLKKSLGVFAILALAGTPALSPASAQVETVDPNDVIDADLAAPDYDGNFEPETSRSSTVADAPLDSDINADIVAPSGTATTGAQSGDSIGAAIEDSNTYQDDDLIGAAEGVFGKGAKGLAEVIEDILKKQGRPNAYIAGREASGAFVVGLRYGSGKLYHKVEGERPVYWTGPSIGFDIGGNAANTFVLVYNLYDTEELYQRFPAGEGAAYFIGGFHVSYLRSGDKVLIPVRLGAGLRLGANVGYMKFSKKQKWLPF
ncbi:DUF1134 domain-containing protein [Sphingorhabdus sp. SMR4y]|uniref:DUF1134 domain-containing protein n=1 Tax=Sphingorhabdus sp. SMR4y TaxID=2584094 RepID=UPI000B5C9BB3|nr:DUF1134 domain-containing protein [Sphingorhabdus sp. SMR4y]ASK89158.1 hypothetical protein SPHFLASMR4Y_02416 [Sphingorhabdus sp. SMR4y]